MNRYGMSERMWPPIPRRWVVQPKYDGVLDYLDRHFVLQLATLGSVPVVLVVIVVGIFW